MPTIDGNEELSDGLAQEEKADVPIFEFDATEKYVRITKERKGGFIEFDYSIGEPDIFAELILKKKDFEEFCVANNVTTLPSLSPSPVEKNDWDWRISDAVRFTKK